MAIRNQLDISIQLSKPFTEYANVVYAPHTYTYSFTVDQVVLGGYEQSLTSAWYEATKMHAPVLVTEFGGPTSGAGLERLGNITMQQDEHLTGSTFWVWKEKGGGGWSMWVGNEGEEGMHLQESRVKFLSRARPTNVAGQLTKLEYDPDAMTMLMKGTAPVEDEGGDATLTLVYIPVRVKGEGSVGGAAELEKTEEMPDGSRLLHVRVKSAGAEYSVAVGRELE